MNGLWAVAAGPLDAVDGLADSVMKRPAKPLV
jgi:hypothetical protein